MAESAKVMKVKATIRRRAAMRLPKQGHGAFVLPSAEGRTVFNPAEAEGERPNQKVPHA